MLQWLKFWFKKGDPVSHTWYNQVADWLNNFIVLPPLSLTKNPHSMVLGIDLPAPPDTPGVTVTIQITGLHPSSPAEGSANPCAYLGDVYGNGPDVAATQSGVTVFSMYRLAQPVLLRASQWIHAVCIANYPWLDSGSSIITETCYFAQYDWHRAINLTIGAQIIGGQFECFVAAQNNVGAYDAVCTISNYVPLLASLYPGNAVVGFRTGWDAGEAKDSFACFVPIEFRVKVDGTDSVPDFLENKINPGKALAKAAQDKDGGFVDERELLLDVEVQNSIEVSPNDDTGKLQLVGDAASPGNDKVYGTSAAGAKGWRDFPAGADEKVKASAGDATAGYLDGKVAKSIVVSSDKLQLENDLASPGTRRFYGTTSGGVRAWQQFEQITVMTAVQYDAATKKFQCKTRTCWVFAPLGVSAWTDVFTASECA